jgi:hypothetical protein
MLDHTFACLLQKWATHQLDCSVDVASLTIPEHLQNDFKLVYVQLRTVHKPQYSGNLLIDVRILKLGQRSQETIQHLAGDLCRMFAAGSTQLALTILLILQCPSFEQH